MGLWQKVCRADFKVTALICTSWRYPVSCSTRRIHTRLGGGGFFVRPYTHSHTHTAHLHTHTLHTSPTHPLHQHTTFLHTNCTARGCWCVLYGVGGRVHGGMQLGYVMRSRVEGVAVTSHTQLHGQRGGTQER